MNRLGIEVRFWMCVVGFFVNAYILFIAPTLGTLFFLAAFAAGVFLYYSVGESLEVSNAAARSTRVRASDLKPGPSPREGASGKHPSDAPGDQSSKGSGAGPNDPEGRH
jgi:hypothetical protein